MASLSVARSLRKALFTPRSISISATARSTNPHGGDGTAYKEREIASENIYIHKREEEAAKLRKKQQQQQEQVGLLYLSRGWILKWFDECAIIFL